MSGQHSKIDECKARVDAISKQIADVENSLQALERERNKLLDDLAVASCPFNAGDIIELPFARWIGNRPKFTGEVWRVRIGTIQHPFTNASIDAPSDYDSETYDEYEARYGTWSCLATQVDENGKRVGILINQPTLTQKYYAIRMKYWANYVAEQTG